MYVRKSIKKLGIVFLAGILLSASLSFHISAGRYDSAAGGHICDHSYYTFADKTIIGGVRGRYYWMDPNLAYSVSSGTNDNYMHLVSLAFGYWRNAKNYTGVVVNMTFNRDNSQRDAAALEILQDTDIGIGLFGSTTFWAGDKEIYVARDGSLAKNYEKAKIQLNPVAMNEYIPDNQSNQRLGTIMHEIGHALGLTHRNHTPGSIMCQYGYGRTVWRPSASDCYAVNHLYP